MERRVFTQGEVKELFEKFVVANVKNDIGDARYNEVWRTYRPSPGAPVPYYAVLNHDAELVAGIGSTLQESDPVAAFAGFLRENLNGHGSAALPPDTEQTDARPAEWPEGLPDPIPSWLRERMNFEAAFSADAVRPGGEVTLELRFDLKEGASGPNNLYLPDSPHAAVADYPVFLAELVALSGLTPVGDWQFPEAHKVPASQSVFGAEEWKLFGEIVIVRRFKVPAGAATGELLVTGTLTGQICDWQGCIQFPDFDQAIGWVAKLSVSADGVAQAIVPPSIDTKGFDGKKAPVVPGGEDGSLTGMLAQYGPILMLVMIFLLGMVTLLTPCVLPVLPLTISFFVKQAEQGRSSLLAALIYCSCIVGTFTFFGFLTSILMGPQGGQIIATNGYVNLAIGLLFVVLALSFFGAFELQMPNFIRGWISKKQMGAQQKGRGYMTALLSGGSFSIISFSCTGPIAAAILAGAAGAGSTGAETGLLSGQWLPFMAMLAFSMGLAAPIFVVGQFPALLKKMPKSGGWMNALKVVFAFLEIAIAIRYFAWADIYFSEGAYPAFLTREVVDAFWIACTLAAGLYLLGLFRLPHDHEPVERIGTTRTLIALFFLSFAVWMLPGLINGKPMGLVDGFLPPRVVESPFNWTEDLEAALEEARITGQPVFVDFTGDICANCRWVETNILPKEPVRGKLESDFILVHQWTDRRGEHGEEARQNYRKYVGGQAGYPVPAYVVIDADGNVLSHFVPPQFINSVTPAQFARFLDEGMAAHRANQR